MESALGGLPLALLAVLCAYTALPLWLAARRLPQTSCTATAEGTEPGAGAGV
ncbi:hypothetical protein [Streptomyces sp. NPDC047976]|uniref:hypothetical protein n=1 Tax=Streptomyces sp. NPDC047976 TaxID=3155746 RepID=UPI003420BA24